jgi:nucleoside-diphosphate-sugar epimerase
MRVVVTGASGNIGTGVLAALERDPAVAEVVAVARRAPERPGPGAKVRWIAADVSRDPLGPVLQGADAVVHLAWILNPSRDREELRRVNVGGSERVFAAAVAAGARTVIHASSIGAYSPGPKDRLVGEDWPTDGIPGFSYSEDKVAVERRLDALEAAHPDVRWVRMRPALVLKRGAAAHLRRELVGAWLIGRLVAPERLPLDPAPPPPAHPDRPHGRRGGGVPARAARRGRRRLQRRGRSRGGRPQLRGAHGRAHRPRPDAPRARPASGRPHAADRAGRAGVDGRDAALAARGPARARRELGWTPVHSALDALLETLQGLRDGAGEATPPLEPHAGGPLRVKEFLSSAGARGAAGPLAPADRAQRTRTAIPG